MLTDDVKRAVEEASEGGKFPHGISRNPTFGEPMRGIWASVTNPIRDGYYVETIRRTGRLNPGTFYRMTDRNGKLWMYPAESTVFLTPITAHLQEQEKGREKAK
jgi:hypothetical protein